MNKKQKELTMIETIHEKPTSNNILHGERLKVFP